MSFQQLRGLLQGHLLFADGGLNCQDDDQIVTGHDPASEHCAEHDAKDGQLAGPPVELTIGHKIGPVHLFDGFEGTGLGAMDVGGKGFSERPHLFIYVGDTLNSFYYFCQEREVYSLSYHPLAQPNSHIGGLKLISNGLSGLELS